MSDAPDLGPVALCTLVARDGEALVGAYADWMHLQVAGHGPMDSGTAAALDFPELVGQTNWIMANSNGREWLQVVEFPDATERDHLASFGWLAMEVLVKAVDDLAGRPITDRDRPDRGYGPAFSGYPLRDGLRYPVLRRQPPS